MMIPLISLFTQTFNLITNGERPLAFAIANNTVFYASESSMLAWILKRNKIKYDKILMPNNNILFTFSINKNKLVINNRELDKYEYKSYLPAVTTNQGGWKYPKTNLPIQFPKTKSFCPQNNIDLVKAQMEKYELRRPAQNHTWDTYRKGQHVCSISDCQKPIEASDFGSGILIGDDIICATCSDLFFYIGWNFYFNEVRKAA